MLDSEDWQRVWRVIAAGSRQTAAPVGWAALGLLDGSAYLGGEIDHLQCVLRWSGCLRCLRAVGSSRDGTGNSRAGVTGQVAQHMA